LVGGGAPSDLGRQRRRAELSRLAAAALVAVFEYNYSKRFTRPLSAKKTNPTLSSM